jgi:toxin FitB
MIAAAAAAHGLPLYTRNSRDFTGLEAEVEIVAV